MTQNLLLGESMHDDQETSLIPAALLGGLYALGISSWRLVELARLPGDLQVHPDFPTWLMTYLWAICLSLFVIGGTTIVISILILTHRLRSRQWLLLPALGIGAWILVHGVFSLQDKAVGEGGLVWGVFHVVTLTRIFSDSSEMGLMGYRVGQVIGLLLWCIFPLILLAESGLNLNELYSEKREATRDDPDV